MPSLYLTPADYATYGLDPATTTVADVTQASILLDGYLNRDEGLVWSSDYAGRPCYMAACSPNFTFTAPGAISVGSSVVVPVTGGFLNDELIGEVLILDRSDTAKTEAVIVNAIDMAGGTITLAKVEKAHNAGSLLESDLVITEERSVPAKRSIVRFSNGPMVRLISGVGRYGYGRRTDQQAGMFAEYNLLAAIGAFGGPPAWVPFDANSASISNQSYEVWVPSGILLAYYSDVRLHYIAGWPATAIPSVIKQATANVIQAAASALLPTNVRSYKAGDTQITRFDNSIIDQPTRAMLESYRQRAFG